MRTAAKAAMVAGLIGLFLLFLARRFPAFVGGIDFPDFYCAGVMARQHVDLYDGALQQRCQVREAGRRGTYYIHPPFEAFLFVPLALLSLRQAYLAWSILGCGLLACSLRLLVKEFWFGWSWETMVAVSFLYTPVLLNFAQGQDSVLLLAIVASALIQFYRSRYASAGVLLALGLFKFHLVLPMGLLLAIRGRARFVAAFSATGLALAGVSVAVFGTRIFSVYFHFLRALPDLPMSGVHWRAMANVRGLTGTLLPDGSTWNVIVVAGISTVLILLGAWVWLRARAPEQTALALGATVIIALLAGYHLNPHDLVLLLVPMIILMWHATQGPMRRWTVALCTAIFLPPVHILLLSSEFYVVMGILAVTLLGTTVAAFQRCSDRIQPTQQKGVP